MSRTKKGAKGPGYEMDRKKEGKKGWQGASKFEKVKSNRVARRNSKKVAEKEDK